MALSNYIVEDSVALHSKALDSLSNIDVTEGPMGREFAPILIKLSQFGACLRDILADSRFIFCFQTKARIEAERAATPPKQYPPTPD